MQTIKGVKPKEVKELHEILTEAEGKEIKVNGAIHLIRDMGEVVFIVLRKREGLLQCVYTVKKASAAGNTLKSLKEGDIIKARGTVHKEARAPHGVELRLQEVISRLAPTARKSVKEYRDISLEAKLDQRAITLRSPKEQARFKLQEGLVRGFRDFLYKEGFTEIHTPKIGAKGAEGGANIFKLDYFHRSAVLEQSPQFYKQMMVGVFERVFETAPVFRAEKHSTKRHLNEYTSLDLEMGYIDGFEEIMEMETGYLQYAMALLQAEYADSLALLDVKLPKVTEIPALRFEEAKKRVSEKYGRPMRAPYDLEPEEELLIGQYVKEEYDADFVFVTHYPSKKRPFYAMDDPENPAVTLSFDLLFRGLEVTTGGQRIHDYEMLMEKLQKRGMETEGMEHYLSAFRYGLPPHGGLGIGLERLTMKLTGEDNVRETTLFPRDLSRLEP